MPHGRRQDVRVDATIKGNHPALPLLPVMDHQRLKRSQAERSAVNKAQMRCLTKKPSPCMGSACTSMPAKTSRKPTEPAPKDAGRWPTPSPLPPLSEEDKLYFDELAQGRGSGVRKQRQSDAFERVEIEQLTTSRSCTCGPGSGSRCAPASKVEKAPEGSVTVNYSRQSPIGSESYRRFVTSFQCFWLRDRWLQPVRACEPREGSWLEGERLGHVPCLVWFDLGTWDATRCTTWP